MGGGKSKLARETLESLRQCELWKMDRSPASRAVMMSIDALGLNITENDIDLDKGEHKCKKIVLMNPLCTLPILKDKELTLFDSHTISMYLATRYCEETSFLPQAPVQRARVEQVMHFDSGVLYPRYSAAVHPILYEKSHTITPTAAHNIECAYADLEAMLRGRVWLGAAASPTLADISVLATTSTLNVLVPINEQKYPLLAHWLSRMSKQWYYNTANEKGLFEFSSRMVHNPGKDSNKNVDGNDKEAASVMSLNRRVKAKDDTQHSKIKQ